MLAAGAPVLEQVRAGKKQENRGGRMIQFSQEEQELMERAIDCLRTQQFGYIQRLQSIPIEGSSHCKYSPEIIGVVVKEWDRQMGYFALLCAISDKLSKSKHLGDLTLKEPVVEKEIKP
jgi:hypothetical protein